MKTRPFGKTGMRVSEIGLGCWQLGGADWGNVDESLAMDVLGAAMDVGVTFFDTADVYGAGRSEELIGRFLKKRPSPVFVATKVGRSPDLYPDTCTEAGVRKAIEDSLRRLGVESIDLTQLHCVPPAVLRRGEVFDWLRKLQQDGKIRYFGASVETIEEGLLCLDQPGLASLQIIFNIFRQRPADVLLPRAKEAGVAVIARLPLASGLLSGKFSKDTKFPGNDHRNYNCDGQVFNVGETFAGIPFDKGVELADELKDFVPDAMSMVEMAQRWILDFKEISVCIPGASSVAQVRENAGVSLLPRLTETLTDRLGYYYQTQIEPFIRGGY